MSDNEPIKEPDRWPVAATLLVLVAVAAIVFLSLAAVWGIFPQVRDVGVAPPQRFAAPTLETGPVSDYRNWRAQQQSALAGGGGRVAISEAMAEVARRGSSAYAPGPSP